MQREFASAGPFRFYVNDYDSTFVLESVDFSEGRIVRKELNGSSFIYEPHFFIKDHLGSVRAVVKADGEILQQNDFQPYGEKILAGGLASGENDYLYCGKEFQSFFDMPFYDSGARFQRNDGIFLSVDPLAEKYYGISSYAYCGGNPINRVDPEGRDDWTINPSGKVEWLQENNKNTLYAVDSKGISTGKKIVLSSDKYLNDLSKNVEEESPNFTTAPSADFKEMSNLFYFLSDNSTVEWVIHADNSNILLGTVSSEDHAGNWKSLGFPSRPNYSIHSHPNVSEQFEIPSMGYELNSEGGASIWMPSDAYNMINMRDFYAIICFVYFPESHHLYAYDKDGYKKMNNKIIIHSNKSKKR